MKIEELSERNGLGVELDISGHVCSADCGTPYLYGRLPDNSTAIPVRIVPEAEFLRLKRIKEAADEIAKSCGDILPHMELAELCKALAPSEPPKPKYPKAKYIAGTHGKYRVEGHPGVWLGISKPDEHAIKACCDGDAEPVSWIRDTEFEAAIDAARKGA